MTVAEDARVRRISVVVPMRDEAHRVKGLIDDLAAQDFDGEVEVLVADGRSSDDSRGLLAAAAAHARLNLTLIDNPRGAVAPGLNAMIERARGDLIVRLDCKSRYPADYLRRCARAAEETSAWVVGGVVVPVGERPTERAVACAMDSMFGGIDWSRHRRSPGRVEVDTVYCGAFRPVAFERVGAFASLHSHDEEFNLRLRRAGGRVIMDPAIRAYYTPRNSLREVFRQYHDYGFGKPTVMLRHGQVVSARSLAPPTFVASIALLAGLGARSPAARRLLAAELASYLGCALGFALAVTRRRHESWGLLPRVVAVFPAFHLAYGIGVIHGFARVNRLRAELAQPCVPHPLGTRLRA